MRIFVLALAAAAVGATGLLPSRALAQPAPSPASAASAAQAQIDENKRRTDLLQSRLDLLEVETAIAQAKFPLLEGTVGKTGALTIESSDRDKFHVTAQSAKAFRDAAKKLLVDAFPSGGNPASNVALIGDADRMAIALYRSEQTALDNLAAKRSDIVSAPLMPEAVGTALLTVGSALQQIAQISQLFRTDVSLAFTDSTLPDQLLLDMVAQELGARARYPAGEIDRLLAKDSETSFTTQLLKELGFREKLRDKGEPGKAILGELEALSTRLATTDPASKLPALFTVLRGEEASDALASTPLSLSIVVASKGGTSMKTSSTFRSDRLYAAGGVIASYRLSERMPAVSLSGGGTSRPRTNIRAGVTIVETGFKRVELKQEE